MKIKSILIAAIVAASVPATVLAESRPLHEPRSPGDCASVERSDDAPFVWRVLRFPFRAAYTVVRTPLIGYETISGHRTIMSRDGFLTPDQARNDELDLRRVPFAGDQPDDD